MDIDTVLRQEELQRSLAAQHKLDISSRRSNRRKRPTLPLVVENREIEQTVKSFYRKLRKVNQHFIIFSYSVPPPKLVEVVGGLQREGVLV